MLHRKVTGSGLPILLLHGFCENSSLWENISANLKSNYKVITIDLPGFGKSNPDEGNSSIEKIAPSIHHMMVSDLQIDQYVVIGHSLGGYISLALADIFPAAILGIGLVNSTSFADSEDKKVLRNKIVEFVNKHGVATFLEGFVGNLFTTENQQKLSVDIANVLKMGNNLSKSTLTTYLRAMRDRPDRSYLLNKLNHVLFIGGREDKHISLTDIEKQIRALKNYENGYFFDKVAHMSMYEAVNGLQNAINHFLLSVKKMENG